MATLDRAIEIAARAHAGQRDKEGLPYILHPLRAMMRVQGEEAQIVAVLHDTVEDTALTEDDLRREGFAEDVLAALRLVTHAKDEPYADYVVRLAVDPIARQVKLADLEDNSRLERSLVRAASLERDFKRIHRYQLSYKFLTGQLCEADYRKAMAAYG
jgi:(p)ppGpp synthase/HD superfamily hydrolase